MNNRQKLSFIRLASDKQQKLFPFLHKTAAIVRNRSMLILKRQIFHVKVLTVRSFLKNKQSFPARECFLQKPIKQI